MKTFIAKISNHIIQSTAWAIARLEIAAEKMSEWIDQKAPQEVTQGEGVPVKVPSAWRSAAVLTMMLAILIAADYGALQGARLVCQRLSIGKLSNPASTYQMTFAPRPPLPLNDNIARGWWARRAIINDERPSLFMVSGASRLQSGQIVAGKWVCLAGNDRLTYDYRSQRWE